MQDVNSQDGKKSSKYKRNWTMICQIKYSSKSKYVLSMWWDQCSKYLDIVNQKRHSLTSKFFFHNIKIILTFILSVFGWILKWSKILWIDVDPFRTQYCLVYSAVNFLIEIPSKDNSRARLRDIICELEKVGNRQSQYYYWPRGNYLTLE